MFWRGFAVWWAAGPGVRLRGELARELDRLVVDVQACLGEGQLDRVAPALRRMSTLSDLALARGELRAPEYGHVQVVLALAADLTA